MNLEELEKQVILLEDIQEIEHLQKIYGYYFDTHNWAKIIDLFSENTESVEVADHGIMYGKKGVKKSSTGMLLQVAAAINSHPGLNLLLHK